MYIRLHYTGMYILYQHIGLYGQLAGELKTPWAGIYMRGVLYVAYRVK